MAAVIEIETARLLLRQWRRADREPFAVLNADPVVMERIGMHNAHEDFEHPGVPERNPLRMHCLYRLRKEQWLASDA